MKNARLKKWMQGKQGRMEDWGGVDSGFKEAEEAGRDLNLQLVLRRLNSQTVASPSDFHELDAESAKALELEAVTKNVVGVHWFRGSLKEKELEWLRELFVGFFGSEYESRTGGFWFYDRYDRWPCGAMICYSGTEENRLQQNGFITLELPGKVLDTFGFDDLGILITNLGKHGFVGTKMDAYYDDYDRVIDPCTLYNLVYDPGLYPGDTPKHDFFGFRDITPAWSGDAQGLKQNMLYFGVRGRKWGSGKSLCHYDKALESGDPNGPYRWEARLTGVYAIEFFDRLLAAWDPDAPWKLARVIGSTVGGLIDFRKHTGRAGDKNINRLERYEFWDTIKHKIGSAKLAGKRVVRTVETTCDWVWKFVVGSLQLGRKAYGEGFVTKLLERVRADDRLTYAHRLMLDEFEGLKARVASMGPQNLHERWDADHVGLQMEGIPSMIGQLSRRRPGVPGLTGGTLPLW